MCRPTCSGLLQWGRARVSAEMDLMTEAEHARLTAGFNGAALV